MIANLIIVCCAVGVLLLGYRLPRGSPDDGNTAYAVAGVACVGSIAVAVREGAFYRFGLSSIGVLGLGVLLGWSIRWRFVRQPMSRGVAALRGVVFDAAVSAALFLLAIVVADSQPFTEINILTISTLLGLPVCILVLAFAASVLESAEEEPLVDEGGATRNSAHEFREDERR